MTIIERAIDAARAKVAGQPATARERSSGSRRRPSPPGPTEAIAFTRLVDGGNLMTEAKDRSVFEQFRRLKRPLLQAAFGPLAAPGTQVIMVTSPLQNAGKTFVSSNLAWVLAMEKDREVLLIDMDNAHQSLTRQLGMTDRPGLFDMINDETMEARQAIYATDMPGLSVLPAGLTATDSLERLNSARCREVFLQIIAADNSRILILDAPPLLVTHEGPAIASIAGQVLLVVAAGETAKSGLTRSLELLDRQKPIGLILNKAPGKAGPDFYYPT